MSEPVEPPPLPELWEFALNAAGLEQLVSDLLQHAEILSVTEKLRAGQHAGEAQVVPAEALARLWEGTIAGVQIRYRFADAEWCDTLRRRPDDVHLVRCRYGNANPAR